MTYRDVIKPILAACVFSVVVGFVIGAEVADKDWKQRAVSAGKAEWTVTTNGVVEWRWKL